MTGLISDLAQDHSNIVCYSSVFVTDIAKTCLVGSYRIGIHRYVDVLYEGVPFLLVLDTAKKR